MNKKSPDDSLKILTHILGIFTWFIGSLVIFVISKKQEEKEHSKNALNWQISFTIYFFVLMTLMILSINKIGWSIAFIGLIFILAILNIIFCIIATVKASEDKFWKYPMAIRFLRNKK